MSLRFRSVAAFLFVITMALGLVATAMIAALSPSAARAQASDPFINMVTSPAPAGSGSLAPILGLNSHNTDNDAQLDAAKAAGFTWIRTDLMYDDIEKSNGVYNFSAFDYLINSLDARGMKALFIFDNKYNNGIRTASERTVIGDFAEAAARHFAGHGARYEVWNEEDSEFWQPRPNVTQYNELLKSILPRIRAGDPSALVTTGGLAAFDLDFLSAMLSSGAVNGYDAVAVHSYWMDGDPETVFSELSQWQAVKNQYPMGSLPDWMTEHSYGLNEDWGGGVITSATKYAAWTARLILSEWAAGFKMIVIYDADADGGGQGLLNAPNILGYQAVSTLSQMAEGRTFTGFSIPSDNTQLNLLRMEGPSDVTYAMWMRTGNKTMQVPPGTIAKDMVGNTIPLTPSGSQLSLVISATDGPVYLTWQRR